MFSVGCDACRVLDCEARADSGSPYSARAFASPSARAFCSDRRQPPWIRRIIRDALDEYELETGLKFSLVRDGEADVYVTASARQTRDACPHLPYVVGCADIPGDEIWLRPLCTRPACRPPIYGYADFIGNSEFRETVKHELTHALFGLQHFEMPCAYLSTNDASDLPYQQGVRSPQWVDRAIALGDCREREDLRELHLPLINIDGR